MKLTFNSSTTILQVEDFIRTLRPKEGTAQYYIIYNFPELMHTNGLTLAHWDKDEDEDAGCFHFGFAQKVKGGWSIYAGSGIQSIKYVASKDGTLVTYEGPFNGLGESPYTPPLDLQEVLRGEVCASEYKGNVKGYLSHRAKTLVRLFTSEWETRLIGASLPSLFSNNGWSLWFYQDVAPANGLEGLGFDWAGSPVKIEFLPACPEKSDRAWDSKNFFRQGGWAQMPEWAKEAIQ